METYEFIRLIIIDIVTVVTFMITFVVGILLALNGIKCLLRSEMMHTYYRNKESGKIREYEMQNFIALHKAYKALKGNSFIDIIHKEVITWEVIS
jgi:hypothetical protein